MAAREFQLPGGAADPVEAFDVLVCDECHRSIYNLWRQVLDYFDAFLIGLTATPTKQTIGFFASNLVTEYGHEQAVADGVNVGCRQALSRSTTPGCGTGWPASAGRWIR